MLTNRYYEDHFLSEIDITETNKKAAQESQHISLKTASSFVRRASYSLTSPLINVNSVLEILGE